MTAMALVCSFSFLLIRSNEGIVKMAFIINIIMSGFLILIGELAIFLSLVFFNFLIFFIASIAALEEPEDKSFQDPVIDIPVIIIMLIIVGMAIISIFQNLDFLKIREIDFSYFKSSNVINFSQYADIVSIIFIVFISVILFFNSKVLKK